jgi:PTS system glucose-specific IIC component
MFYKLDPTQFGSIFTSNVGIKSLSTSVFGGIAIGFIVAFLYNKFKNIQLPTVLGFFSGIRFIPIVTFAASFVLGLVFSII